MGQRATPSRQDDGVPGVGDTLPNGDNADDRKIIVRGPAAVAAAAGLATLRAERPTVVFDELHKSGKWRNLRNGSVTRRVAWFTWLRCGGRRAFPARSAKGKRPGSPELDFDGVSPVGVGCLSLPGLCCTAAESRSVIGSRRCVTCAVKRTVKRAWLAAEFGLWQLPHQLGMAAPHATRGRSARSLPIHRRGGS